jgi:hypothetical protein
LPPEKMRRSRREWRDAWPEQGIVFVTRSWRSLWQATSEAGAVPGLAAVVGESF